MVAGWAIQGIAAGCRYLRLGLNKGYYGGLFFANQAFVPIKSQRSQFEDSLGGSVRLPMPENRVSISASFFISNPSRRLIGSFLLVETRNKIFQIFKLFGASEQPVEYAPLAERDIQPNQI